MEEERRQGREGVVVRKVLATMWECAVCGYANFRRASECRACQRGRAHGSRLVQQWWVASALPAGWDHEPHPTARRVGVAGGGGGFGNGPGGGGFFGDGRRGGGGPTGAGNSRPMVLRRGERGPADSCPTVSAAQQNGQLRGGGGGVASSVATRNRWTAPPNNRPGDARLDAPGTLDGARGRGRGEGAGDTAGGDGAEDWQQGLSKIQRKRLRQRARRRQEGGGGGEGGQERNNDSTDDDEGAGADDNDGSTGEPIGPYQPPPMPRLLLVRQAEQLQKRLEAMQQKGSRPQLLQRAEKRLEDARRLVRDAGGPTERRLVFSILQEETRERKLRESIPKADQEIADREAQLLEAQKALDDAKRKKTDLETKWRNSKARVAFLAAEKAAETLPQEQTSAVHEALQSLLVAVPPSMQPQARLVSDYFRAVAPLPARVPEESFHELSDGDTHDEAHSMDGVEDGARQGTKRALQEVQGAGALPAPARSAGSLEEAKSQLAQLRHQKLAAISAAFNRDTAAPGHVPPMAPAELADRYDCEMQRALEQVRAYAAEEAKAREQTPCQPGGGLQAGDAGEDGAVDRTEGEGGAGGRGGKAARVGDAANREQAEGGHGAAAAAKGAVPEENRGEDAGGQPTRTRWEQSSSSQNSPPSAGEWPAAPVAGMELECPACGRGPMAREALRGQCECGAAVCLDCSEGGVTVNSCLVCFDRCEEAVASGGAAEGMEAPGPLAFAGTLSGEGQGRGAPRRATPY